MQSRITTTLACLFLSSTAFASEGMKTQEIQLRPNEIFELLTALQVVEVHPRVLKDGQSEKTFNEPVVIPAGLATLIAYDIRALKVASENYQVAQHYVLGELSQGSGYLAKGSPEEAKANFKLFDLANTKVTVKIAFLPLDELVKANSSIGPVLQAQLVPLLSEEK